MKNFYKKMFANYSPLFLLFMGLIILGSFSIRSTVEVPISTIGTHAEFLSQFGIPKTLITAKPEIYFNVELLISVAMLILAFFLGKQIAGKTEGLFIAAFMGFYPYFTSNCYSISNYFWLLFMLYLLFQLKSCFTLYKKWAIFSGVFFTLSVIANPICLFLGLVPYIYYFIKSRNIAILYNFLFFLLGILIALSPFMLYVLLNDKGFSYILPFRATFSPFAKNFGIFLDGPLDYLKNNILPVITITLAKPSYYGELNSYSYLHYIIITLSILGILYTFIEEKIRVVFFIFLAFLIQAFFMPVNFGLLFMFIIFIGSYMVDKVVHDVFC